MNTFFDLREFLITLLKKMRLSFILICICTICGGLMRFVPLIQEYINYDKIVSEKLTNASSDYPYLYEARRTIYIEPEYMTIGDEVIDRSQNVIATYLACYQNKEILQPLVDKYYKEAALLYSKNQKSKLDYHFITGAAIGDFTLPDFYRMITIKVVNNRLVSLYAKSSDSAFSEALVGDATDLLSTYVKDLVGDYSYTVTEGQIGISLPEDTTGVVLKPNNNIVNERNTLSFILIRSIKGCIWGLGLGTALSLILCFFFYAVSQIIYEEEDLREFGIPVLASFIDKKASKVKIQDRLITFLRGNKVEFYDYSDCANVVRELLSLKTDTSETSIAISGSCDFSYIQKFCAALNEGNKTQIFCPAENIVYSSDALNKLKSISSIVLVEKLNDSSKVEIQRELDRIQYLGKTIHGFIVIR